MNDLFNRLVLLALLCCFTLTTQPSNAFSVRLLPDSAEKAQHTHSAQSYPAQRSPIAKAPVGSNVDSFTDWAGEIPLIDVFKTSRPWIPKSDLKFDTGEAEAIQIDGAGWVTSLPDPNDRSIEFTSVVTVLFSKLEQGYPEGEFTVLYKGEGTIKYSGDATLVSSEPGKDIVYFSPDSPVKGAIIEITETDPNGTGNYIRDIQVLLPGYTAEDAETLIFNPAFIDSIDEYSVLRLLNWLQINYDGNWETNAAIRTRSSQTIVNPLDQTDYNPRWLQIDWDIPVLWRDRPKMTDARYSTEKGVPLELIAALAKATNSDLWLNIPHHVDNYYAWKSATLMLDELGSTTQIYLEYSNEIWNSGFGQGNYMENEALKNGITGNPFEARLKWYGNRSVQLCNVWKDT